MIEVQGNRILAESAVNAAVLNLVLVDGFPAILDHEPAPFRAVLNPLPDSTLGAARAVVVLRPSTGLTRLRQPSSATRSLDHVIRIPVSSGGCLVH